MHHRMHINYFNTKELSMKEHASYSKPTQRDVDRAETDLLINLSAVTQRGLAEMVGCHESKISRTDWRFIAAVLCSFGMDSDISPISRAFHHALNAIAKDKAPSCCNSLDA